MSLYQKPQNITLVDMCIYIDNTVYTQECDDQKIFEYLYHIIKMKAKEKKYFHKLFYYEDFAIYGATRVYMRLVNPKQNIILPDGTPKLKKIKGVLNYVNSILYALKVDFEQTEYYQSPYYNDNNDFITFNFNNVYLTSQNYTPEKIEYKLVLQDVYTICNEELQKLKHLYKSNVWKNICFSVKLSLLDQLTLSKKEYPYINHLFKTGRLTDEYIIKKFNQQKDNVKLFHLSSDYKKYILLLTRIIKKKIAIYISNMLQVNYVDPTLTDILFSECVQFLEGVNNDEFN